MALPERGGGIYPLPGFFWRICPQCTFCSICSFGLNKLGHILKFVICNTIQHIFVTFCSVRRNMGKGSSHFKKNGKKRGHCPLFRRPPPPKRVKRGHLLSDYRQKCVNGTRDSYFGVKSPFLSDLRLILTHIVVSKVHF